MPFTNLNRRLDYSRKNNTSSKKKRNWKKFFLKFFVTLLILFVVIYLPIRGVYSSARALVASSRAVSDGMKRENLDDIRKNIKAMRSASGGLNTSLNFLFWAGFIPYFGGYYSDIKHLSKASEYELDAASTLADSLDPYKQELGFIGQPAPGQDRVAQFVKIMDKIIPQLDKVVPDLKKASAEVENIDVNKYPEEFGKYRVRSLVDTAKNFITGASFAVTEARPALQVAPSVLGEPNPKNYMLIFQNDKELRATGGFMTAYAYLKFDKGRVSSSQSDDIYRLDERLLNVCLNVICPLTPPDPIVKYLPEANGKPRTAWSMRDSNLSPDVPTSMKTFEKMYSFLNGEKFDGVILIDTHVVEELIKITGPIEVFGTTYSAQIDKRCNCPNVIYELEAYAQIIEKGEKDRKAVLGTLMQQILARSLVASTDKLPEFINAGVKLAQAKHMIFYMHDDSTEQALAKLNWTGGIKVPSQGDYLMINDSNFAGGKSNLYMYEDVNLDINTDSFGKVKSKLTLTYKNDQAFGIWLNGINRDYVRVYVPQGAKLIANKGSDDPVHTFDDLGHTVFDAFIQVRPQNYRTLSFEYELPKNASGKEYPILIQKQPGTKDFNYTIKVNGKTKQQFKLDMDKDLKLSI